MDDLTQAAHIAAGMNVTIDRAIALVAAANYFAAEPAAPITIGNVVFGADFVNKRPKAKIGGGTL